MRKIFALIVSSVCLVLGVLSLINAIECFKVLSNCAESQKTFYLTTGISQSAFFIVSVISMIGTFISCFKYRRVGHAAEYAVFSLACFVISEGVTCYAQWTMIKGQVNITQTDITISMVSMIIAFISGGCLLLSCIDRMIFRKLFGIVGSIIGLAVFGLACINFNNYGTLAKIVVIGGLITFVLGFILMLAIPKKDKLTKEKN